MPRLCASHTLIPWRLSMTVVRDVSVVDTLAPAPRLFLIPYVLQVQQTRWQPRVKVAKYENLPDVPLSPGIGFHGRSNRLSGDFFSSKELSWYAQQYDVSAELLFWAHLRSQYYTSAGKTRDTLCLAQNSFIQPPEFIPWVRNIY